MSLVNKSLSAPESKPMDMSVKLKYPQLSFEKNYDIKSLEKSIEIANHQIAIAKNWENPMIAFKTNEINSSTWALVVASRTAMPE